MKNILAPTQMFVAPDDSGASSSNKYLGIITDIGIFSAHTRPQLFQYVWQCLCDMGVSVDSRGPYELEFQERGRVSDPYVVHIVNPETGYVLIEIYGNTEMAIVTVAFLLSHKFWRHNVDVFDYGKRIQHFPAFCSG